MRFTRYAGLGLVICAVLAASVWAGVTRPPLGVKGMLFLDDIVFDPGNPGDLAP